MDFKKIIYATNEELVSNLSDSEKQKLNIQLDEFQKEFSESRAIKNADFSFGDSPLTLSIAIESFGYLLPGDLEVFKDIESQVHEVMRDKSSQEQQIIPISRETPSVEEKDLVAYKQRQADIVSKFEDKKLTTDQFMFESINEVIKYSKESQTNDLDLKGLRSRLTPAQMGFLFREESYTLKKYEDIGARNFSAIEKVGYTNFWKEAMNSAIDKFSTEHKQYQAQQEIPKPVISNEVDSMLKKFNPEGSEIRKDLPIENIDKVAPTIKLKR